MLMDTINRRSRSKQMFVLRNNRLGQKASSTFAMLSVLDLRRLLAAVLLLLLLDPAFLDIQRFPFQLEPPTDDVLVFRHLAATARFDRKSPGKRRSAEIEKSAAPDLGEGEPRRQSRAAQLKP